MIFFTGIRFKLNDAYSFQNGLLLTYFSLYAHLEYFQNLIKKNLVDTYYKI